MKVSGAMKKTVLVVDDEAFIRDLLRQHLESDGYSVLVAEDGAKAVALSQGHQGPIHLLLTDMKMPGIDGSLLAGRLTASRPDTKVLYISGYLPGSAVHHNATATGTAFLLKPFTRETLLRTVRVILDAS